MSHVEVELRLARGDFVVDVAFAVGQRGVTSLFGASGAGKTSVLRCLAGLEPEARGSVRVGGVTWQDDQRFVPAWRRPVGYVFQEPSLFPHLDVRGNLLYGERRVPPARRRVTFADAVAWLELGPLLDRRTTSLSGGERQRVAIGRALLVSPELLLMDEPLTALDAASRARILPYLEALPARLSAPIVYVSHSLQEVARLCDHVVWLDRGRVRGAGPLGEMLPAIDAAAEDEGLSVVLTGTVTVQHASDELTEVAVAGTALFLRRFAAEPGAAVRVQVLARDVSLALDPEPRSSILNVLPARVVRAHVAGGRALVELGLADGARLFARITARSCHALALAPGTAVFARMKSVGLVAGPGRASS